jgi:class 3 adenylate cyclase/predicted ATPase
MKCGVKLERKCSHCGTEFPEDAIFCMKCGNRLDSQSAPVDGSQEEITPEAERRQLTVMFCDLVDSTPLSEQLDPEDLRKVVRAYQDTCGKIIHRFEGNIAQYLGDGLLVYFGYPQAHEDDAQRAARTGLGIVEAITRLNPRLNEKWGVELAVRIGIHTGLVVAGEMGSGNSREHLAMGETPNIAARLQNEAAPNTVLVSAATYRLIEGFFACQQLSTLVPKGFSQPIDVCQLSQESSARSRLGTVVSARPTPMVGRDQEIGLLYERWEQIEEGMGQVVLLSGEAGVGKSRLVQAMKEHVGQDPQAWLTPCQCSAYHRNSAFYPLIDVLERIVLQFERGDDPAKKLSRLEGFLAQYAIPQLEMVPLFADLLSIPLNDNYTPSNLSPERKKQLILQTILGVLLEIANRQPLLLVIEDLHWADPTTLEFLNLLVDQIPTTRIFALFTFRPDFSPPWSGRAHLTNLTLRRLTRKQVVIMIQHVAGGKLLPAAVLEQIVKKTDGVPLFVEELTKMVLESGLLREKEEDYELAGPLPPLAIPATLQDSLMARLDRLASAKEIVQLSAILGRELTYEMLQAVSSLDEDTLQQGLSRLVEAELLYQRGIPPKATYTFKHALIQETAYQSLLKGTRQQYHQRIAGMLAGEFAETVATQPELVAHHYTEAGLGEQAVPFWQQAGQLAMERSANEEAIAHLTRGLEVLGELPESAERDQQELALQMALGSSLIVSKGYAVAEVEQTYSKALELCRRIGDTPEVVPVLYALGRYYYVFRAEFQIAHDLGVRLMKLAQDQNDAAALMMAHTVLGITSFWTGQFVATREHVEQALTLFDSGMRRDRDFRYAQDIRIVCLCYRVWTLMHLGYPKQAIEVLQEMEALSDELLHPPSTALFLVTACFLHYWRRDAQKTQESADSLLATSAEYGFAQWMPFGTIFMTWSQIQNGAGELEIEQLRQAIIDWQGVFCFEIVLPLFQGVLTDAYRTAGIVEQGLEVVGEALVKVERSGERQEEARLHLMKGELLLIQSDPDEQHAEGCFQQAVKVSRRQSAKYPELQAAMSLSRLWQAQGRKEEARSLLSDVYGWFTEGFDTKDLIEAKALLDELS